MSLFWYIEFRSLLAEEYREKEKKKQEKETEKKMLTIFPMDGSVTNFKASRDD